MPTAYAVEDFGELGGAVVLPHAADHDVGPRHESEGVGGSGEGVAGSDRSSRGSLSVGHRLDCEHGSSAAAQQGFSSGLGGVGDGDDEEAS
jgi:hypothetical protein